MAVHEFGLMPTPPQPGQRYDNYRPEAYAAISVDDCFIEGILPELTSVDLYWHTVDVPGKGLAYTGITLIPPNAAEAILRIVSARPGLSGLRSLLQTAQREGKWIIHFGL